VELEDAGRQDNEAFSRQVAVTEESQSVAGSLEDTLSKSALQVRESLKAIRKTAEVTTLCIEGQRNPDEMLTEVANKGFKEMLANLAPIYSKFFFEDITIKSEIQILQRDKEGKRRVASDIDVTMRTLKPFIEVGISVNGVPAKSVRIVFKLDTSVNIKKAELQVTSDNKIETKLDDMVATLELSLARITTLGLELPISRDGRILERPVKLLQREFQIRSAATQEVASQLPPAGPGSVKSIDDMFRELYCNKCSKQVKAVRFCPDCGNRLQVP
jgi:hypothetical protein